MKYLRALLITLLTASGMVLAEPVSNEADDKVKIPQSKYVRSIYSGGDPRDYSEDIKQNHKQYTDWRGMDYQFHDLSESGSPVMKALNGKQKYWAKIVILQQAMNDSNIPEGSWVAWVDDDIVINDVNHSPAMIDRIIQKHGEGKSVIVAKEDSDWAYLNTGIMLIKKDQGGRDVLENLMKKSDQSKFGKLDQTKSFHEQGALKELYLGSDKDSAGENLKRHVAVVPQRDEELNFNNFRRFSHTDENRLIKNPETQEFEPMELVYDDSQSAKAQDTDAFIHHTGMKQSLRSDSIKKTINDVNKTPLNFFPEESDEKFKADQVERRNSIREEKIKERDEKRRGTPISPPSEEELTAYQREHRDNTRKERLKERDENIRKRDEKRRGIPVSPPSEEKLKADQRKHRDNIRKERIKERDEKIRKQAEERAKLDEAKKKAEPEVIEEPVVSATDTVKPAEEAVEPYNLYDSLKAQLLSEVSETVEQGILGVQSLNSAASMMMLTTMTGFSSAMSGFRTGRLFSYGMTSIDEVVPEGAVASIHPPAQGRTISREVGSWHNFVQLNMLQGDRKAVDGLPGGSVKGHGLTAGVFYQLDEDLITGMMLSIGKTQHSLSQANGSGSIESIGIGPFISYTKNDWHIDGALTYSSDSYAMKHSDALGNQFKSEFSGNTLTGYLGVGYDIHLESLSPSLTLTPMIEVIHSRSSHDSYQEKTSQSQGMKIGSSSTQVTSTRFGLELGYLMDLENPMELKVRAGMQHQTISGQSTSYELPFGMQGQLSVPGSSEKALFTGLALHKRVGSGHMALSYSGTHSSASSSHGLQLEYERSF
ncbi:hypothetical protein EOPP23_01675 [Endozoicomonas sp. OPT23]|uniref:autotransporter domain-containing protein n=1 Tax=Endozoicomonas sp. OPT23 TaxID=2072845 RepID=UPI00129B173F|nr:autotransporter domain-containing protein [Endozoicomonas sp. OPT23]MRI31704.1 hypothetical protein [Endozoicomonas sp. OPT23]